MFISGEGLNHILSNLDPLNQSKNFLWTTDYKVELPIRVKKHGPGSEKP
jgi:long-chain-fatty-acid--CoA ligase ACSBG